MAADDPTCSGCWESGLEDLGCEDCFGLIPASSTKSASVACCCRSSFRISSGLKPLDSRKDVFRSTEALRMSSSFRNFEAFSIRDARASVIGCFSDPTAWSPSAVSSSEFSWSCHDGMPFDPGASGLPIVTFGCGYEVVKHCTDTICWSNGPGLLVAGAERGGNGSNLSRSSVFRSQKTSKDPMKGDQIEKEINLCQCNYPRLFRKSAGCYSREDRPLSTFAGIVRHVTRYRAFTRFNPSQLSARSMADRPNKRQRSSSFVGGEGEYKAGRPKNNTKPAQTAAGSSNAYVCFLRNPSSYQHR